LDFSNHSYLCKGLKLEPAALSKPILFGPNVFNFSEISADLLKQQGSIQVQNADALMQEITQLLEDDKKSNISIV
jgi:3-deoxy-D-manno-octulosonic-acid transferase